LPGGSRGLGDVYKRQEQVSLTITPNEFNKKYLATKADRLGHSGGK
jgi:GTP cyclohydrolase II